MLVPHKEHKILDRFLGLHTVRFNEYWLTRFEMGNCDKLFITGYPGAGKTYLAERLGKEFGVKVYCTDDIKYKINKEHPEYTRQEYLEAFSKELSKVIRRKERAIIEGVGVTRIDYSIISKNAVIVVRKRLIDCIFGYIYARRDWGLSLVTLLKQAISLNRKWRREVDVFDNYINFN